MALVRTALRLELNNDSHRKSDIIREMNETEKKIDGLFEPFSIGAYARDLVSDENRWNEDAYNEQIVYLKTNFSKKRFMHCLDMRDKLNGR